MEPSLQEPAKDLNIRYSYSKIVRKMTMKVETTKMSSKGQIVIPQDIRDEIEADEGTIFVVMASGDTLILKKVQTPSKEELIKDLKEFAKEGSKNADKLGIKEGDVPNMVHKLRKSKRLNESNPRH